ncbi:MAG TPA: sigma 54-interacting transcriptional regulator [Candidatus Eisenbacteria bacterium]
MELNVERGGFSRPEWMEEAVGRLLDTPLRVHLWGETGSGKNHLAYRFRDHVMAAGRPFVEINVANLSDELLEGELFGCRRGAFTGAVADRAGVLERAEGGILFLNEVGELSAAGQAKLLTLLDTGLYRRLGDPTERRFTARVISATNRNLTRCVRAGAFREDLYYRLAQVRILVMSLRDREGEAVRMARAVLDRLAIERGRPLHFDSRAITRIEAYHWPGNIRQLKSVVETLAWLAPGNLITGHALEEQIRQAGVDTEALFDRSFLRERVDELERVEIEKALGATFGNKTQAAARLGLSVVGLRLKLKRLGFEE